MWGYNLICVGLLGKRFPKKIHSIRDPQKNIIFNPQSLYIIYLFVHFIYDVFYLLRFSKILSFSSFDLLFEKNLDSHEKTIFHNWTKHTSNRGSTAYRLFQGMIFCKLFTIDDRRDYGKIDQAKILEYNTKILIKLLPPNSPKHEIRNIVNSKNRYCELSREYCIKKKKSVRHIFVRTYLTFHAFITKFTLFHRTIILWFH